MKNNQFIYKLISLTIFFPTIQFAYVYPKSHDNVLTFLREVKTLSKKTEKKMEDAAKTSSGASAITYGGLVALGGLVAVAATSALYPILIISSSIAATPAGIAYAVLGFAKGFSLKHKNDIKVSFKATDKCITKNQPYTGISFSNNKINVMAGRKGSKSTAKCFSNWFKNGGANVFDHQPRKLNFAIKGTLTIIYPLKHPVNITDPNTGNEISQTTETYVFNNIVLAQGHQGLSNNWWFGGTDCTINGPETVECPLANLENNDKAAVCFSRANNHVSSISVTTCVPVKK